MQRSAFFVVASIAVMAVILYAGILRPAAHQSAPGQEPSLEMAKGVPSVVHRIVDGDTIVLADRTKVRMVGIDTPELHRSEKLLRDSRRSHRDIAVIQAAGEKAKAFTSGLCNGRKVLLRYDVERRDRYGRTLAYVYLEDGTFVNAEIIKAGYARLLTIPPNVAHVDLFRKLEQQAREGQRGLWADNAI